MSTESNPTCIIATEPTPSKMSEIQGDAKLDIEVEEVSSTETNVLPSKPTLAISIDTPADTKTPKTPSTLPENNLRIHLNDKVILTDDQSGVVKYIGQLQKSTETYYGIDVSTNIDGGNNGTLNNIQYFISKTQKSAKFVTLTDIKSVQTTAKSALFTLNDKVMCTRPKYEGIGVVRYIGYPSFSKKKNTIHYGLQMDKESGNCNGTIDGVCYFTCNDKYGVYCREDLIEEIKGRSLSCCSLSTSNGDLAIEENEKLVASNPISPKVSANEDELNAVDLYASLDEDNQASTNEEEISRVESNKSESVLEKMMHRMDYLEKQLKLQSEMLADQQKTIVMQEKLLAENKLQLRKLSTVSITPCPAEFASANNNNNNEDDGKKENSVSSKTKLSLKSLVLKEDEERKASLTDFRIPNGMLRTSKSLSSISTSRTQRRKSSIFAMLSKPKELKLQAMYQFGVTEEEHKNIEACFTHVFETCDKISCNELIRRFEEVYQYRVAVFKNFKNSKSDYFWCGVTGSRSQWQVNKDMFIIYLIKKIEH